MFDPSTTPSSRSVPIARPADVRLADPAVDFAARDDRHLAPSIKPMRRLKYGSTSWFEPQAEREDVVALEEERALLREEQRKPRQVRPARVDFRFREVGVDRRRREHVGSDALRDVEARVKLAFGGRRWGRNAAACGHRRPNAQSRHRGRNRVRSVISPARLVCVTTYWRTGDAQRSVSSRRWMRRCTLKCHSCRPGLNAERENRDTDLHTPAGRESRRRRLPDAVPVGVVTFAARIDQAVISGAGRIHREYIAGPPVRERPDDDADVVLGCQHGIAADAEAHDAGGVGFVAHDPDDQGTRVGEHLDARPRRRRGAFHRIGLPQIVDRLRRLPGRFGQAAVDGDVRRHRAGAERRRCALRQNWPGEERHEYPYGQTEGLFRVFLADITFVHFVVEGS